MNDDADHPYETVEIREKPPVNTELIGASTCNEWHLFHGTNIGASRGISNTNFRLSLSGSGATWKEPGADKGSPLYGYGIYMAECVTKSDEYADVIPEEEEDGGLHPMLVCRVLGGRRNVVLTNEIQKEK